ncbi:MAG TPA: heparinase II/III-family protein, partial [Pyrinomonadaceae bacterium]|nr:heparinase II/III-family protein [Pyrinomonadaceae bacterium]
AGAAVETLWLLGVDDLRRLDKVVKKEPEQKSIAFADSGYYVMRDSWTSEANYLLFDCGPHGWANCGHAHADALAFELAASGRTQLVDPGTFTYTGARELRDWFRSSAAHNSLTIAGRSSSVSAGPFSWNSIARCQPLNWITRDRFDYVSGAHDGYANPPIAATHERSILFLKDDYWFIRDLVKSTAEQNVDLWFHFDPRSDALIEAVDEETFIAESKGDSGLDLHIFAEKGRWRREEGWVSHCYAQRSAARVYRFSASLGGGRSALTLALPRTSGSRWTVRAIEAVGGQAFALANENWLDLVMIREHEKVETAQFASNFEWTWARFSRKESALPQEIVLINGQNLLFEGRELLQAPQPMSYSYLHRVDDKFRVESDGPNREISFRQTL